MRALAVLEENTMDAARLGSDRRNVT